VDVENVPKKNIISRLLGNKDKNPASSPCPVCGKADSVTVIKLQEDKVYVQPEKN